MAESIVPFLKSEEEKDILKIKDRDFRIFYKRDEKLLYFIDVTEQTEIEKRYENERTAIMSIFPR